MFTLCGSCKKDVEPGVDRETLGPNKKVTSDTKAVCPDCREDLKLSSFMIQSMVSMGKYYSKPKAEKAFSFECKSCSKIRLAKVVKDKAFCMECDQDLELSPFMVKAMTLSKSGGIDPK